MREPIRLWLKALGVCLAATAVVIALYLPVPHVLVLLITLFWLVPCALIAIGLGSFWDFRLAVKATLTALPTAFLIGGMLGWAAVPREWTASLWTTIDASMNAAKYGAAFEHTAERVLMYFMLGGAIGAFVGSIVSICAVARSTIIRRDVLATKRNSAPGS